MIRSGLTASALMAMAALTGCSVERAREPPAAVMPAIDPASRITVAAREIADLRPTPARFTTADEAMARARAAGTLVRLSVDEGAMVAAGEVIAVVDEARMGAEVALARAGAAQAPALLAQARAEAARADADFNRTKILTDRGVYAPARLDQMQAARDAAAAQVRAAQAGVAAAEAQLAVATAMRAEGAVRAPRAGRVIAVPMPQGAVVMPGEVIAVIAAGAPVLKLAAPEADAAALRIGQTVALADAQGAPAGAARVVKIYPAVAGGLVEVDLDSGPTAGRFVGEQVSVLLPVGLRRGIMIPASHVLARGGVEYVRLVRGESALDVPVQLGARRPEGVEVLSGLVEGDVIAAPARAAAP